MKRVALFTGNYNHVADGVSRTLNRLVGYFETRADVEVLVFGPTVDDPPIEHEGTLVAVPSIPMPGRPEYRISTALPSEVREQIEAFDPHLVHIATPDVLGLRARSWAMKKKKPLVGTYHTHFSSYLQYYYMGLLEPAMWTYLRWFYRPFRQIYVPSPSMIDVLKAEGIDHGVQLWERGVETDRFHPSKRSLEWRRDLGFADDDLVVSFISRLVWEKGPDVFADVIEALQARDIPHRSLIVGAGPAREELTERLPKTVFTGFLEGDALTTAYASSDIFLFPSETETFGNVTLEAMASGLPVVCADATGSKSLVEVGETGYLALPGDTDAFLQPVVRLLEDANLRHRMGRAARTHAQAFDWSVILQKMVTYYDEVLENTATP